MNGIHQIYRFSVCLIGQPANIRVSCPDRQNSYKKFCDVAVMAIYMRRGLVWIIELDAKALD